MYHQTTTLRLKHIDEKGVFTGYASVFNTVDRHHEIVAPGAFQKSIKSADMPKMLWQHDPKYPIGRWTKIEETPKGLWVEGKLFLDLPKAKEAYTLLQENILDGLSIGFRPTRVKNAEKYRTILDLDLFEISLVTFAANPEAKIMTCKSSDNARLISKIQAARQALNMVNS